MSACTSLGYPWGRHNGDEYGVDGSPYPFGECTDHLWRSYRQQGVQLAGHMGNALEWMRSAGTQGYTVYNTPPGTNVIACWDARAYPPFGHVAKVESSGPDSFTVSEMNFCYGVRAGSGHAADPGHVDSRVVSKSDPQPVGFILPTGAGIGAGTASTLSTGGPGDLLGQLAGIGTAIDQAGAQLDANIQTFKNKLVSGAQIGLGVGLGLSGGTVIGLAALGKRPDMMASRGARVVSRRARRARRQAPPLVREQFPQSTPQLPEVDVQPGAGARRIPEARATRQLGQPGRYKRSGFGPADSELRQKVRAAAERGKISAADRRSYDRMRAKEAGRR